SGDAFLHERVKVFRRDEDFAATLLTLERLLELDFDALLCGHRPRFSQGKRALAAKLAWLRDVEGRVRSLHDSGAPMAEITKRLGVRPGLLNYMTLGDTSTANMVRSILRGPELRVEMASIQQRMR